MRKQRLPVGREMARQREREGDEEWLRERNQRDRQTDGRQKGFCARRREGEAAACPAAESELFTNPQAEAGRPNVFEVSGQHGDVKRVPGKLWSGFSPDTSPPMPQGTHAMNRACAL